MKKFICWLFAKSITPEIKLVFTDEGSSFEYATNTVYLNFNDDCDGFIRHLKFVHGLRGADNFNVIMWQILHEIGHYFTLDYCEDNENLERAICALIDEDEAKNSEKIQNIYFNLEKEWEATEWAINYLIDNQKKCTFFSKLLDILI
jgi:hypothetical protein